jgi:hypothetical protein
VIRNETGSIVATIDTTNGTASVQLIDGVYNITFDSSDHELKSQIVTVVNTSQFTDVHFNVYTTNSVLFTFRDSVTNALVTGNISLEFISDVLSQNYTTSNSTLYVDLLSPTSYIIRSVANASYVPNLYYLVLQNRTFNNITIYLKPK